MSFEDKIARSLSACGNEELAIVADGQFYQRASKLVYVKVKHSDGEGTYPELEFSTKAALDNSNEIVENAATELLAKMKTNSIGKVKIAEFSDIAKCQISVCTTMHLLILESQLYSGIRIIESQRASDKTFVVREHVLSPTELMALKTEFHEQSYRSFQNTIFSASSNRFTGKLMKYNRFYGIQSAYIPVFVQYRHLYNPFDEFGDALSNFKLYEVAVEKDRKIDIDGVLQCYMLTHREICEALGMHHFMRFTPAFLYRLTVGLLKPELLDFPNKGNKSVIRPTDTATNYVKQVKFTEDEFLQRIDELQKELQEEVETTKQAELEATLAELKSYKLVNSLYYEISRNYSKLINIGSSCLDAKNNTTIEMLYSYVSEV